MAETIPCCRNCVHFAEGARHLESYKSITRHVVGRCERTKHLIYCGEARKPRGRCHSANCITNGEQAKAVIGKEDTGRNP